MKKFARPLLILGAACTLVVQSGCYGSFGLTNKLYNWNDEVAENKFVKSLLFWVLCVIPVYEICVMADVAILNLIEFWSGSSPISMKAGDYEQQVVEKNGVHYKMEATQNKFAITVLDGKQAGKKTSFVYLENDQTWNIDNNGTLVTIAKVKMDGNGNNSVAYFATSGKVINQSLPSNETELAAVIQGRNMNVAVK